jgi:uncharacterized protein
MGRIKCTTDMKRNKRSTLFILLLTAVGWAATHIYATTAEERTVAAGNSVEDNSEAKALYDQAVRYKKGDGFPKDPVKAAEYLMKSARLGYVWAQTDLGSCYGKGEGVTQDLEEAFKWYHAAARQGDALGQYCLGFCYMTGHGVVTNLNEGIQWWRKAAETGLPEAQNALGQLYLERGRGETNSDHFAESAKWLKKAAEQGCTPAMNNLGFLYQYGLGVEKDHGEAFKWYRTAAEKGEPKAQANLGIMYQEGFGIPQDLVTAYKWFLLSAAQRDPVGKHFVEDYKLHHLITTNQMAQAQQIATEFRIKLASSKFQKPASR